MPIAKAYAAPAAKAPLAPFSVTRREPGPSDIVVDIQYCGVCHSDIHQVRDEWGGASFPMVPGHEIVGRVSRIGAAVSRFEVGDSAGVGCFVDSCRTCGSCRDGEEQYCESTPVFTYNSRDKAGEPTYGGYSESIVVDEAYAVSISPKLDLASAAPLLCAGITTFSPLRRWKIGAGHRVGVIGLGGLGHMGVKFARALGAHVVLFSSSPAKAEDARRLGADEVASSRDPEVLASYAKRLDFILDTVSAPHDINAFLSMLKRDGTMVLLGVPEVPHALQTFPLLINRRSLSGSLIGGIAETQAMMDFCAEHGLVSDVEVIPVQQINAAYERVVRGDVKYRFVIDMASLRAS